MKKILFKGCGTAIATPFDENGVNEKEFEKLIEFQIQNKVDSIIVCGTTGEATTMSTEEKDIAIKCAINTSKKRVPIIVGTGSNSTNQAIQNSIHAKELGADGILVVTPYYNKCTQQGLIEHFTKIANSVFPLPVILYNVPGRTGVNILPKTCFELSKVENIVAITAEGNTSHALAADGSVYSWGYNLYGQLGVNNTTNSSYPVKMQKVSNIIQISGGANHVSMLDADGSVWNVGYNGNGQFGINNTASASLPIQMQDTDGSILYGVKEVAAGRYHNVVLKEDGTVWTVGNNSGGALGDGTANNKNVIIQVKK